MASYFITGPRIIKKLKKFDIIHANQASAIFAYLKPMINRPFVVTIHDVYANDWKKYYKFPMHEIGKKLEIIWSKAKYDTIITVSNNSKNKLRNICT